MSVFLLCALICVCCAGCFVAGMILGQSANRPSYSAAQDKAAPGMFAFSGQDLAQYRTKTAPITLTEDHEMSVEAANSRDSDGGDNE